MRAVQSQIGRIVRGDLAVRADGSRFTSEISALANAAQHMVHHLESTLAGMELSGIRRILPDIARVLPEEERGPVAYVYSRGGRFAPYAATYEGEQLKARWEKPLQVYNEEAAQAVNSQTGKHYSGIPRFKPPLLTNGRPMLSLLAR